MLTLKCVVGDDIGMQPAIANEIYIENIGLVY